MLDGAEREWWETEDGDTSAPDVDIDPRFTCSVCGVRFIPTGKRHTKTCGAAKCAAQNRYRVERTNEQRYAKAQARWRKSVIEHGAYYNARASLRRRGLLTSETAAALLPLRGKGHIEVSAALAMCGLGALARSKSLKSSGTNAKTKRDRLDPSEGADAWSLRSPETTAHIAHVVALQFFDGSIPRRRITDYGGARILHGALHAALGCGHSRDETPFALVLPTATAPLYFVELELSRERRLIDRLPSSVLLASDSRPLELRKSSMIRLRAPAPREAGQYRARVIASGPLVLKKSNRVLAKHAKDVERIYLHQLQLEPSDLVGALERVASRIGLQIHPSAIIARVIAHDLDQLHPIRVGGHWRVGNVKGCIDACVGHIDVECNAVGRWLLDVAALIGLGSKTTIGMGRVRVQDL